MICVASNQPQTHTHPLHKSLPPFPSFFFFTPKQTRCATTIAATIHPFPLKFFIFFLSALISSKWVSLLQENELLPWLVVTATSLCFSLLCLRYRTSFLFSFMDVGTYPFQCWVRDGSDAVN